MKYLLGRTWKSIQSAAGQVLVYLSQRINPPRFKSSPPRNKPITKSRTPRTPHPKADVSSSQEVNELDQGFYESSRSVERSNCSERILPSDINDSFHQSQTSQQPQSMFNFKQTAHRVAIHYQQGEDFLSSDESISEFVLQRGQYEQDRLAQKQHPNHIHKAQTTDSSNVQKTWAERGAEPFTSNLPSFKKKPQEDQTTAQNRPNPQPNTRSCSPCLSILRDRSPTLLNSSPILPIDKRRAQ